tara:strand:+ start:266 stop:928 length:663 start_codon:yes stop_codon:yes gene_type:complete
MKKWKVLNLYACLGGNRLLWDTCEVTAVELDPELARLYQERFPNDTVIIGDAHQYLLDHFKEFDFIWSSPPCPTHSRIRVSQKNREGFKHKYPSMSLYEEILLLDNFFDGKYVVENVIPYYEPLIPGKKRGRHIYWTNFNLPNDLKGRKQEKNMIETGDISTLSNFHDYDFSEYKGEQPKNKIARNLVDYKVGDSIYKVARGLELENDSNQVSIFDQIKD